MTADAAHVERIAIAVAAAFADTDCTIGPFEVKAIVDELWKAQTERTMRAIMEEAGDDRR